MTEIMLGIGVGTFVVYAAFNIVYLMSMKRTGERVNAFLANTEGNINAALEELKGTLQNLRKISGDIRAVTAEVRQISDTVASLEKGMHGIYRYAADAAKEGLGSAAGANIAGLKAGITTGVATLVKSIHEGRRDDHERGTEK